MQCPKPCRPTAPTTVCELTRIWSGCKSPSSLYYLQCTNPDNGLVRDKTEPSAPSSIAAIGMALATIPVVVVRGVIIREFAAKITRRRLRFLMECLQGPEPYASGYKGFSIIFWTSKGPPGLAM
ncbi:hypothetical protein ACVITL_006707 [Rhizobium pisi]